ncbi:hypothetical protein AAVH_30849 [Aphelenchoides avenae]|nr:hypothetical protein AAVH_30849 [Aphelenchus avenae]
MRILSLLLLLVCGSLGQELPQKDGLNEGNANGRDKEVDVIGPPSLPSPFHNHAEPFPTGIPPDEHAKRGKQNDDDDKFASHQQFFGEMATFNMGAFGMIGLTQEKEKEANGSKARSPEAPLSSAAPPPEIETFFWTVPMERSEAPLRPNHVEEAPQRSRSEAEEEEQRRSRMREEDAQRYNAGGRWNGPYKSREFRPDPSREFEPPHPEREWQPAEPPRREWLRPHHPAQRGRWDRPSSSANGRWYEDSELLNSAPVKRRAAPPHEGPWSDAKSRMPQPEAFGEPSYFEEVLEQGEDPTAVRLRDEDVVGWDD